MEYINWLEMWDAWRARLRYGHLHEFCIYRPTVPSGADLEMMLRRYHVGVYGRKIGTSELWRSGDAPDLLGFSVRAKQARWAERLLLSAGVGVVSALVDPGHASLQDDRAGMPRPWTEGGRAETVSGHIVDVLLAFRPDDTERHTAPKWAEGEFVRVGSELRTRDEIGDILRATWAAHNSLARALPVRDVQIYQAGFRAALVAVGLAVGLEWQPTQDTRAAALPSRFDDRF